MRKNRGFTLIELLVVIFIIGILASIVIVSVNAARGRARNARRMADVKELKNAIELFNNDVGNYPQVGAANTSQSTTALAPILNATTQFMVPIVHDPNTNRRDTATDYRYVWANTAAHGYGILLTWDDNTNCITGDRLNLTDDGLADGGWWGKSSANICQL